MKLWGTTTDVAKGLVALPLACAASFLFYQVGTGLGFDGANFILLPTSTKNGPATPQLRAGRLEGPNHTIPACARDVFVTLHKEIGAGGEDACSGLLVSDDIIVTSRACSAFNVTFDFPGLGIARAVPHASLNSREEMAGSRLGFLEAHPPYHYHFIDRQAQRMYLFLSNRSSPCGGAHGANNGKEAREFISCADEIVPVAHSFPVDGEMVPLSSLAGVLSNDFLWEEVDIYTAPMLSYRAHHWWSKAITLNDEDEDIEKIILSFEGPPGSVSIPAAHDSFVGKASALFEAVDPRGHRHQDCFWNYYKRYRRQEPFSGMHFFDWLDFGDGKFLLELNAMKGNLKYMEDDELCYKHKFNKKKVHYFSDEERLEHEVYITPSDDGEELLARYKQNDELVPESPPDEPHLYMWDLEGRLYIVDDTWDDDEYGTVKHTGVMAGRPALSAGEVYFGKGGSIWGINFSSGHYWPEVQALALMYQWVKDQGWNTTALHWVGRQEWSTDSCYLAKWETMEIQGYANADLNRSCYEVTTSPTWIVLEDI